MSIYFLYFTYYIYKATVATNGIPIRKVFIDSRFKTRDSKSNSDFKYELVESVELPKNAVVLLMISSYQ